MKKLVKNLKNKNGFTLLEVIATITVAAILGTFLIAFMGSAVSKSADPVNQIRDLNVSQKNIEQYSALYAEYLVASSQSPPVSPTWAQFKENKIGCASSLPNCPSSAKCCKLTSGSLYNANYETVQVTYTQNKQTIVTYFME